MLTNNRRNKLGCRIRCDTSLTGQRRKARRQNSEDGIQELQNGATDFKSVTRNWELSHFIPML
jgi:hypothetical protein